MLKRLNSKQLLLTVAAIASVFIWGFTSEYTQAIQVDQHRWHQGQEPVRMVPVGNSACFLTAMQGKFLGSAEVIRIIQRGGFWYLEGESKQRDVAASARCVVGYKQPIKVLGEFDWRILEAPTKMVPTYKTACFLTAIQGKFQGSGEVVEIFSQDGYWWLGGRSNAVRVSAKAICIFSEGILGVSGEYRWHQDMGRRSTSMENTDCFLTRVSGKFRGRGELVTIDYIPSSPQYFILWGKSGQKSVQAGARCIRWF